MQIEYEVQRDNPEDCSDDPQILVLGGKPREYLANKFHMVVDREHTVMQLLEGYFGL